MLIILEKSKHEEHLSQPLQTNNKQFETAVVFLTGYNGIFNVTNSNNKIFFKKTISNEGDFFFQNTIPPGGYETESLNVEVRMIIIYKGPYTEDEYPFTMKPNFCASGSIIEISPQGPTTDFVFDDSIRSLLELHETTLYKEYNLSPNLVDI